MIVEIVDNWLIFCAELWLMMKTSVNKIFDIVEVRDNKVIECVQKQLYIENYLENTVDEIVTAIANTASMHFREK